MAKVLRGSSHPRTQDRNMRPRITSSSPSSSWIESTVIRELLRKNSVIKTRGGKRVTHRIVAVSLCIACRRNATQHAVLQPNEGINTLALILAAGPQGDKGSCQAQDDVDAQMWAMLRGLRYVYALKVCRARPA